MQAGLIPSADSPALLLTSEPEAAALTAQQRKDLPGQALVAGDALQTVLGFEKLLGYILSWAWHAQWAPTARDCYSVFFKASCRWPATITGPIV